MTQARVRKAFETRLKTWAAARTPPLPVAYQNASFTPPAPTATNSWGRYLRAFLVPAPTNSVDLEGKHREYVGIFQVSIVLALNRGSADAETILAELDALFPMGAPMVQDGLPIWITRPASAAAPIDEPDNQVIPVSVPYKAEMFLP